MNGRGISFCVAEFPRLDCFTAQNDERAPCIEAPGPRAEHNKRLQYVLGRLLVQGQKIGIDFGLDPQHCFPYLSGDK